MVNLKSNSLAHPIPAISSGAMRSPFQSTELVCSIFMIGAFHLT